jgi:hypothetical protein
VCVYGTGTALLMGFWCLYMFVLGFEKSRLFSFFVLADAQICNDLLPWCFLWLVFCVFFSWGGVKLSPHGTSAIIWHILPATDDR